MTTVIEFRLVKQDPESSDISVGVVGNTIHIHLQGYDAIVTQIFTENEVRALIGILQQALLYVQPDTAKGEDDDDDEDTDELPFQSH